MQLGRWQFSPGLWPTIATLSILPVLLSLGVWQLNRAEQKAVLFQRMLQRIDETPVESLEANMNIDSLLWRKAYLTGRFSKSPAFLLDNQVLKGQAGYFVYSLFRLDNDNVVLVNRGWIMATASRKDIPALDNPQGRLEIQGTIKAPPATGKLLAENTDEKLAPGLYRLQHINLKEIESNYHIALLPYVVRLTAESPAGFRREWRQPGSGREKHLGYAFQWFAMAGTLLLIFLIVNLKKVSRPEL